jgi:hypothetical protein
MKSTITLLAVALLLAGCASKRCKGEQDYQRATSLPPPAKVEGLKAPDATSALKIPPAPANPVPFGEPVADGGLRCLDLPPEMPPEAPAPAEAPPS